MSNIPFLLSNKERRKFFIRCLFMGMPILIIAALLLNYYEDSRNAKGTPNDKGGNNYWYESKSGTTNLPEEAVKIITLYPEAKATYYNFGTDKNGIAEGNIIAFTKDPIEKVIAFYNKAGEVESNSAGRLELKKRGQKIVISKENIRPAEKYQDQTKFEISFRTTK